VRSSVGFETGSQMPFHFKQQQPLTACAWGVVAEARDEDSGDTRTIIVLLQSWWELRAPQRSAHCRYLLKGLRKHVP